MKKEEIDRLPIELGDNINISCDICNMIGPVEEVIYKLSDEKGDIEFLVLEMSECGHGFVSALKDEKINDLVKKVNKLTKTAKLLNGSGDLCGLERTMKKIQNIQKRINNCMKQLWKTRASTISHWPPLPRILD